MRQFEVTRHLLGKDVTANIVCLDEGLHVLIYGGSRPHIGAVSIIEHGTTCKTTQFPNHRDSIVSELWAETLAESCKTPVVVIAGIHYDDPSREDIHMILSTMEQMLQEALALLSVDHAL